MATKKTEDMIKFLKQFNNSIVKFFAYLAKEHPKKFFTFLFAVLVTITLIVNKSHLSKLPYVGKFFIEEKSK